MNTAQTIHITHIMDDVGSDLYEKYSKGTLEHNGLLSEMPADELIQNLTEEVLDLANYLYTLKPKLRAYFRDPLIRNRMAEIDRLEKLVADKRGNDLQPSDQDAKSGQAKAQ